MTAGSWCIWMTVTNQAPAPPPTKNGYNTITCTADVIVRTQVTRLGYCHTRHRKTSKEPVNTSSQSSSPFHQGVYHFPSWCREGIPALDGNPVYHDDDRDPFPALELRIKGSYWVYRSSCFVFLSQINCAATPVVGLALFVIPLSWVSMEEPGRTSRSNLGSGGHGGVHVSQEPSLKVGVVLSDERVDFLREQAFCVLRVKTDKWNRFIGTEDNQRMILDFLDHIWTDKLLLYTGPGGTLHAGNAQVYSPHMQLFVC